MPTLCERFLGRTRSEDQSAERKFYCVEISPEKKLDLDHELTIIPQEPKDVGDRFKQLVLDGKLLVEGGQVFVTVREPNGTLHKIGLINPVSGWDEYRPNVRAGTVLLWRVRQIAGWEDPTGNSYRQ